MKLNKRVLPIFGDTPLAQLDADAIARWQTSMLTEQLSPRTINTYLSLLGTILNTAVADGHPARSPMRTPSGTRRLAPLKTQPTDQREVWLTAQQVARLADGIHPHYHPLITVAAHTGLRFQELAALRWHDLDLRHPLDDGVITGPGRLRVSRVLAGTRRSGTGRDHRPASLAANRTIALDQPSTRALHDHRSLILASNRSPVDWFPLFPNPVVAESLLDRLINTSHQVFMNGPSYRPNKRPGRPEVTGKEVTR